MADFIQSIQIAPDGVVTDIYPEAGNEAGKIDLMHDESRGEICRYGRDKNIVTMQGPFDLKQGGRALRLEILYIWRGQMALQYFGDLP